MQNNKPINKKLVVICISLILSLGIFQVISLIVNHSKNNTPKSTIEVLSPKPISIPSINSLSIDKVNSYINESYERSSTEVLTSKDSGVYNTFSSYSSVNPFNQTYTYSKESGTSKKGLEEYPYSFNGSIASLKDYESKYTETNSGGNVTNTYTSSSTSDNTSDQNTKTTVSANKDSSNAANNTPSSSSDNKDKSTDTNTNNKENTILDTKKS